MERIMVVEDLPDNLLVLQATLEHEGYSVIPMMDGEAALRRLEEEGSGIDLILSDVMMPGISGYDLCRAIRRQPALASLPIVLITAKRLQEQDVLQGIKAGADDYLIRPIDPQLLGRKLRLLLDRKRELEAWQRKYSAQEEAIKSREWGARMLVHDIRNPLSGAIGALSMLATDPSTTEDQRFLVDLARRCLQNQKDMLQDLLTTVAAKNNTLTLNRGSFDLGACVREQIDLQRGVISVEHHEFHCQGLEDGLTVIADRPLIGRVVANLIINAIKYGKRDSEIEIWLGPRARCPLPLPIEAGGQLAFTIINQGAAIPPAVQQQIFQPFTMGENARQAQNDSICMTGVGLGLCFCERVISLHGGAINIISPLPGRSDGVAFYLTL